MMKRILKVIKSHSLKEFLQEHAWLTRYTWRYKGQVLWYLLIGIVGTATSLAGSVLGKYIIDAVTGYDSRGIVVALLFFVLMQLSQIGIHAISGHISARISIRVNQQITAEVYDKLLQTDWEALSDYHSGDLLTRVGGDVATVSSSVLGWIPDLITRLLQFVGTFGVLLYFDKSLALLALLAAPVTLLMSRYVISRMRRHNKKMRQLSSDMTVFNAETFQNLQLIKAVDRTAAYTRKHRNLQERYKEASLDFNRFSIGKNAIMSLAGTVVALLCFSWSIYRLWTGHITYGTMTLFLQLSGSLAAAFSALAGMIPGAISAATAAGRIMAITQLPLEDQTGKEQAAAFLSGCRDGGLSLVAEDLSYQYSDGTPVLSHVHFHTEGTRIITLTGPSGEGKTTLLRLFLGILQPKGGSLTAQDGQGNTVSLCPATRNLFSYVPQGNTLFSGTIRENLQFMAPQATEEEMFRALEIACAAEFVRQLPKGLDTPVRERGGGFSEGQLQRLCIARALLSPAPILLMDEATSALDMDTEQQVLKNIMDAEKHRTCILTTHRLSVIRLSQKIYFVHSDTVEPMTLRELETRLYLSGSEL